MSGIKTVSFDDFGIIVKDIYNKLNDCVPSNVVTGIVALITGTQDKLDEKADKRDVYSKDEMEKTFVSKEDFAAKCPIKTRVVLKKDKWDRDHEQSIDNDNIKDDSMILFAQPIGYEKSIYDDFTKAAIKLSSSYDGGVWFKYEGTAPTMDYDVDICIIN